MNNLNIVFDCTNPDTVSRFWLIALEGYDYPGSDPDGPPGCPPAGFATWEAWADSMGIPEDQRHGVRTIVDVVADRPDIFFIAVPEGKQVKNRVHLDIKATRDVAATDRGAHQDAEAERLIAAGATLIGRVDDHDGSHLVLQDVEGNEFCIT